MAAQARQGQAGAGTVASAPGFVGRHRPLAQITDALERGQALVLIEGEAGIGKSRLLSEALARPPDRTVLVAACPPLPEPFPLGAVVAGLRRLRDRVGEPGLSPLGGALRPLFPEWADRLPPSLEPLDDPKETRHRILRALTELVERLTIEMVVVEDAHWADTATLEWLLTLIAAGDATRSIVITYRPADIPDRSLLRRLTSHPPGGWTQTRVVLEPLDVEQTRQLVGWMLRTDEVSDEFASFLHEHTDGLPLAVEETVRLLRERHDIFRQRGSWARKVLGELDVPPTVRDSVLERVERLDEDARAILWAAAVLGEPVDTSVLATVAELDEEAGRRGIRRASRAGLLRQVGGGLLAFRHQLDARAVEESIPDPDRWALHRRAASALQQLDPQPVVRLARHLRESNDTEAWCHYAEATAELALESGDDRTAVVTLLDVLSAVEHPTDRRVHLAHKLGEAAFFSAAVVDDLVDRVIGVLREVVASSECTPNQRGELRLLLGRALWDGNHKRAAFEEFEAAVPELGHRPDLAIRSMLNLALPLMPDWPAARYRHWLDRAAELVEEAGSPADRRALTRVRATTLLLLGDEAGWEPIEASVAEVPSTAEQRQVIGSLLNIVDATVLWGRYDESYRRLAEAVSFCETTGHVRGLGRARVTRADLDWYTGRWDGLLDVASALAESDDGENALRLAARKLVGQLSLVSGARAATEHHLQAVINEYPPGDFAGIEVVNAPAALARLYLGDGEPQRALALTEPVLEMIAFKDVWLWATDIVLVHVDALILVGRSGDAEQVVHEFGRGVDGRHIPAPAAALKGCQAVLVEAQGDWAEAAELFQDAAAAWAALPRPYDELLALERRGRCRLVSGQQGDGLAVLSEAQQRLVDLGARWDADRIALLLRQHGVEVARTWRRGRSGYGDQLSPRELEVVELVARGMTNKQVGERLFISPKTVGRHLSAAMRKLAVSSRTALAIAASEAGLLSTDGEVKVTEK